MYSRTFNDYNGLTMKYGIIYKATNLLNNKVYVGRTLWTLQKRIRRHIEDSKNPKWYFHEEIAEYGIANFKFEVIEDNVPENQLDDREIFWIAKLDTFYLNNPLGYNMTTGGQNSGGMKRKLSDVDIAKIKELLTTTDIPIVDISRQLNVPMFAVYDLNLGKTWVDSNAVYPLRKNTACRLTQEKFDKSVAMLRTGLFPQEDVVKACGLESGSMVSAINLGRIKTFEYPEDVSFPLCKRKVVSNGLVPVETQLHILRDVVLGMTYKGIMQKYGLKRSHSMSFTRQARLEKKTALGGVKYPLKDHVEENLAIIDQKLKLLKQYA